MKKLLPILLLIFLSKSFFGKGCSGIYFIQGTAYTKNKTVLKNAELTITFGTETKTVTTDEKGHYEMEIKWTNACPSMTTKEQHAIENARLNPEFIYINIQATKLN